MKGFALVFVMMWVRWTLPRLRIDQVMTTCLKYLLPISCVLLMGQTLWLLLVPVPVKQYLPMFLAVISILPLVAVFQQMMFAPAAKNLLPTTWDTMRV